MVPLDTNLFNFSYPGPLSFSLGGVTPAGRTAGFQYISSMGFHNMMSPTYPPTHGMFSPTQAKELYDLGAECQALGLQLTKEFHILMRLEVLHHAVAQAMSHKTINVGHPERGVTYDVLMNKDWTGQNHEETLQKLYKEADKVWVDSNEVVYDHRLHYDTKLLGFIKRTNKNLQEKHADIWDCVKQLADAAEVSQDVGLSIALQVLNLLPTLPVDQKLMLPTPGLWTPYITERPQPQLGRPRLLMG